MSIQVDFLKVTPSDIGDVGSTSACLLALVRYATAVDDDRHGRLVVDGQVWWRVSYTELAAALGGVGRDAVRGAVEKLEAASKLQMLTFADDDRRKAYRPADQPSGETTTPLSSQVVKPPRGVVKRPQGCGETTTSSMSFKEEKKGRTADADAPPDTTPISRQSKGKEQTANPDLVCPNHPEGDTGIACGGCARVKDFRKRQEAEEAEAESKAKESRRKALEGCTVCGGTHWVPGTEPPVRCHHVGGGNETNPAVNDSAPIGDAEFFARLSDVMDRMSDQ